MKKTGQPAGEHNKQADLADMLMELQKDVTIWMLPILFLLGLLCILFANQLNDPLYGIGIGFLFYLLITVILVLRLKSQRGAAMVMVAGLLVLDVLFAATTGVWQILYLLSLPAGLASLTISPIIGVVTTGVCTLLLFNPAGVFPIHTPDRMFITLNLWMTTTLMWLAVLPLRTALEWAWARYREGRDLLEQARDYQGKLTQTLEDLEDANEQLTRLNRLVQTLYHAAEDARRTKDQFVANISHELRTPLNMILGFGEMILRSPGTYGRKLPSALLADLTVIVHNSQHLSGLIDDILDLSQIEAGQVAMTKEYVPVKELVESATIAVRPLFESKHLYLNIECPEDVQLLCDRTRIREVLINLLSNAGRFTEHGGVDLVAERSEDKIIFRVTDTGPGIAPEDQERLFQPFQQADSSIRRRYGGTGLGLSISKNYVEMHGGKMWVKSAKGSGASFIFSLPVAPVSPTEQAVRRWNNPYAYHETRTHPSLAPVPVIRPRYVVLEEGNTLERLLVRYIDNIEVDRVAGIEEAIQRLSVLPAQALLINSENAQQVLDRIDEVGQLPFGIPTMICSLPELEESTSALQIAHYLVKPISRDALLSAIEKIKPEVKTILIVDDDMEAIQLFRRMLVSAEKDYRVLIAADGQQALAIMQVEQLDLILLDLNLPTLSGMELLKIRSADPDLREIPVIITSARDPVDQPVKSETLMISRSGGISAPQILSCIEAISQIFGTAVAAGSPGSLKESPS